MTSSPEGRQEAAVLDVDALAQEIRRVDGKHDLGAGQLAEALMPFLIAHAHPPTDAGVSEAMIKALRKAEQFIVNGVELGYIRMPDLGTPDSAHDTLPAIRAALSTTIPAGNGVPPATVKITRIGWEETDEGRIFTATAAFAEPPAWPINIVWDRIPVRMAPLSTASTAGKG